MLKSEEWPHIFDFPKTGKWQVKLCRLAEDKWKLFGEGNIHGEYDKSLDEYRVLVTSSGDDSCVLFCSIINSPVSVQKQDTTLLWTSPDKELLSAETEDVNWADTNGLASIAIGFQAATGCASISEFVLYANFRLSIENRISFMVQPSGGADGNFDRSGEVVEMPIILPPSPNKLNLTSVLNIFIEALKSHLGREFLIVYLDSTQYLSRLWSVFEEVRPSQTAENIKKVAPNENPLEVIQNLWKISDIVKQYCLVGDIYLLEEIIESDRFSKVLQMLEYDRTFGTRKANFFEYYYEHTALKKVFELADAPIVEKIHRTFRLQLLRDVLVRCADDFAFHLVRTLIYLYHSEIIEKLQNTPKFCDILFSLFGDTPLKPSNETTDTKDDAIRFIHDLMKTSKTFAYSQQKTLYLTLIDSGLISAIVYGINPARRNKIKMLALESLSILIDFDVGHTIQFRQTIMEAIMNLAVDQERTPHTFGKIHATRAVNLEIAELLKKMLLDSPPEMMDFFFINLRDFLVMIEGDVSVSPMMLVPFLEILTHCFTSHPDACGVLMKNYSIWWHLASIMETLDKSRRAVTNRIAVGAMPSKLEAGMSPTHDLSYKIERQHGSAQIDMALIRLIREAIQPSVLTPTLQCAEQAMCTIESGLFTTLARSHIRKYVQQSTTHDAEMSSFLNLLYIIVDGETHTSAQQFKVYTSWLRNEGRLETQLLSKKYTFLKRLFNRKPGYRHLETSTKRLHDSTSQEDTTLDHSGRSRVSVTLAPCQMVDERDEEISTLPAAAFSNHFPPGLVEKSGPGKESQQPSTSIIENIGEPDRVDPAEQDKSMPAQHISSIAGFDDASYREMSHPIPSHPWWDSGTVQRRLENSG